MKIFEGFDGDNMKENHDTKIGVVEKIIMNTAAIVAKMIIRKILRAKTYGDIYGLVKRMEKAMRGFDDKMCADGEDHENPTDTEVLDILKVMEEAI